MPTVFRQDGYRFFFFSNEGVEPMHVHVASGDAHAKLWLKPVTFAESHGLNSKQLRDIRQVVEHRRAEIEEAWNEHFAP